MWHMYVSYLLCALSLWQVLYHVEFCFRDHLCLHQESMFVDGFQHIVIRNLIQIFTMVGNIRLYNTDIMVVDSSLTSFHCLQWRHWHLHFDWYRVPADWGERSTNWVEWFLLWKWFYFWMNFWFWEPEIQKVKCIRKRWLAQLRYLHCWYLLHENFVLFPIERKVQKEELMLPKIEQKSIIIYWKRYMTSYYQIPSWHLWKPFV